MNDNIFSLFGFSLDIWAYEREGEIEDYKQLELSRGLWIITISSTAISLVFADNITRLEYRRGICRDSVGGFRWLKRWNI